MDRTQLEQEIEVTNKIQKQRDKVLLELRRLDMLLNARRARTNKMTLRLVDYLRTSPKYRKVIA